MPDNSSYLVVPSSVLWLLGLAVVSISIIIAAMVLRARRARSAAVAPEPAARPLPEFEKNGQSATASLVQWSPDTLRHILAKELPDAQVIVVSNREPYIHNRKGDEIQLVVPASGLVSALE